MISNKDDLLRDLKIAVYWEEGFLKQYKDEHILELLKTLSKEKSERIKKLLDENLSDTEKHERLTRSIWENIKNGK